MWLVLEPKPHCYSLDNEEDELIVFIENDLDRVMTCKGERYFKDRPDRVLNFQSVINPKQAIQLIDINPNEGVPAFSLGHISPDHDSVTPIEWTNCTLEQVAAAINISLAELKVFLVKNKLAPAESLEEWQDNTGVIDSYSAFNQASNFVHFVSLMQSTLAKQKIVLVKKHEVTEFILQVFFNHYCKDGKSFLRILCPPSCSSTNFYQLIAKELNIAIPNRLFNIQQSISACLENCVFALNGSLHLSAKVLDEIYYQSQKVNCWFILIAPSEAILKRLGVLMGVRERDSLWISSYFMEQISFGFLERVNSSPFELTAVPKETPLVLLQQDLKNERILSAKTSSLFAESIQPIEDAVDRIKKRRSGSTRNLRYFNKKLNDS